MKFAIFGLTISSAWGNGHATTWRGLLKALKRDGHQIVFYEQDVPYYAAHRDLPAPDFCELVLYQTWSDVMLRAQRDVADADVAIVSSYCPDGIAASRLIFDAARPLGVFYDIDTPVTLADLAGHGVASATGTRYLTPELIPEYDLYLSFAGGPLLQQLETVWHARRAAPLYCSVDPDIHGPVPPADAFRCSLGYLGTYAPDRQPALERLLCEPARRRPDERFFVVGPQYPADVEWPPNVQTHRHLDPADHAAFYRANRVTLNVTRQAMVEVGYSPSVRLFEAASCQVPILSDWWPGLETFFIPGREILIAETSAEADSALGLSDAELKRIATAAQSRTLATHTASARARDLVALCESARTSTTDSRQSRRSLV
jgi:spore maturation protein CgeB